jgi:EmrB/QacA subfamily drug resistance transporter
MCVHPAALDRAEDTAPLWCRPCESEIRMRYDRVYERRWWSLAVLCIGLYLVVVANTILNVALPTIQKDLDATGSELQWIVDALVMTFAGLLLVAGNLGDKFGRKGAFMAGLLVFGTASTAASFATSASQLIACQAVMGIGAAFVMPTTLSLLTNIFPEHERAKAIAIWAGVSGIAVAAGPLAGGLLLDHFWWGSIFLFNVPMVVLAIVAGAFLVPTSRDEQAPPIDIPGAFLCVTGLVSLLYGIIEGPEKGWTNSWVLTGFASGAVLLMSFVLWEMRSSHPMLEIGFFKNMRFTAANVAITFLYFALFGMIFFLTQYLQYFLGYDALGAGVRFLPLAAGILVATPIGARLVKSIGTKAVVTAGLLLAAAGFVSLLLTDTGSGYGPAALTLLISGFGIGFTMSPATDAIMGSVPKSKAGVGSAMNDTTREVGGALGVAVLGSVLSTGFSSSMSDKIGNRMPEPAKELAKDSIGSAYAVAERTGGRGAGQLLEAARASFLDGMHTSVLVAIGVLLVGAVLTWRFLPARAEEHMDVHDESIDLQCEAA